MTRREWVELRIAAIEQQLAHTRTPPGFRDHHNDRKRDELAQLRRELADMNQGAA